MTTPPWVPWNGYIALWENYCVQRSMSPRQKVGGRLDTEHPQICWLVRHSWLHCRSQVRPEGRTLNGVLHNSFKGWLVSEKSVGHKLQEPGCCVASSKFRSVVAECPTNVRRAINYFFAFSPAQSARPIINDMRCPSVCRLVCLSVLSFSVCLLAGLYVCTSVCLYVCVWRCICICRCTCISICSCRFFYIYVSVDVSVDGDVYVCVDMYVCMDICMDIWKYGWRPMCKPFRKLHVTRMIRGIGPVLFSTNS